MTYTNFSDSGSTLTPDEIRTEAAKLLDLLRDSHWETRASERAHQFLTQQYQSIEMYGAAKCTVKQLYWLRDLVLQLVD